MRPDPADRLRQVARPTPSPDNRFRVDVAPPLRPEDSHGTQP